MISDIVAYILMFIIWNTYIPIIPMLRYFFILFIAFPYVFVLIGSLMYLIIKWKEWYELN